MGLRIEQFPCAGTVAATLPNLTQPYIIPSFDTEALLSANDAEGVGPQYLADHDGVPLDMQVPPTTAPNSSAWLTTPDRAVILNQVFELSDDEFDFASIPGYTVDVSADFVVVVGGATVSDFIDQALSNDYLQATTTNQPAYEAAGWTDSTPSVLFDGIDNYVTCITSLAQDLVGGVDKAFTLFIVTQLVVDNPGDAALVAFGNTASLPPIVRIADSGVGLVNFWKRDNANVTQMSTSVSVGTVPRLITLIYSGTTYILQIDGVTSATGSVNVGDTTVNRASIGALVRSAVGSFCNERFKRMIGYVGELTPEQYSSVNTALIDEHF